MLSLNSQDNDGDENTFRAPIDLVCVIDRSNSMKRGRIDLVRAAINQLIELLGDKDRLSLVEFNDAADRICPLMLCNKKNKETLLKYVTNIQCKGATDITHGAKVAFEIIRQRNQKNYITSIFLLSDGQDGYAYKGVETLIEQYKTTYQMKECYTIHTFGFGQDHDAKLMNQISQMSGGNFYNID